MKIILSGKKATKQDIIDIAKFLREKWKDRTDTMLIQIIEGTNDMNVEELRKLLEEVFSGKPAFEMIITKEKIEND